MTHYEKDSDKPRLRLAALALLVHLAWAGGAMSWGTPAHAQGAASPQPEAASARKRYEIPAGPLGAVMARFAGASGVLLAGSSALVQGRDSPGLSGLYTPDEAIRAMLAGTGLEAVRQADGSHALRQVASSLRPLPNAPTSGNSLPAIRVTAAPLRDATSEGTGSYAARAVSIGKGAATTLREVPQSVSVITRQQIEDQAMGSVGDALAQTPGVYLSTVSSELSAFQSRGYDLETAYDGISISTGAGADFGRSVLDDLSVVDRVEVLRGPAALLRGGNASPGLGGVVNIVRKKPQREFSLAGELIAGSWAQLGGSLDVGGPLNAAGSVRGRAVASAKRHDYFYDGAQARRSGVYGVIEADLTPQTLLTLSAHHQDLDRTGPMGRVPRYDSDRRIASTDRSASFGADWERLNRRTSTVSAELQHTFANDWKARAAVSHQLEDYDFPGLFVDGWVNADDTADFSTYRFQKDVRTSGYDLSVSGPLMFWGRRHEFVIGVDGSKFADKTVSGPGGFYTNRNIHQPAIARPTWGDDHDRFDFSQRSAYASAQIKALDSVTVVLGARSLLDMRYITRSDAYDASDNDLAASDETTPYGGVIWALGRDLSLYASHAEQFHPQVNRTASGGLLPPKQGTQTEVGIKGEFFDRRLNASFALYRIKESNRPLLDEGNTGCAPSGWCYIASGLIRSQGVEAEVSGSPLRGLQLIAGYTYNENRYLSDDNAANVAQQFNGRTPRHLLKLWSTYRFTGMAGRAVLDGLTLGGGLVAQSGTYVKTSMATIRQGGHAVASALVGYRVDNRTSVTLNVNNLFDRHYLKALSPTSFNYHGDPLNAQLTLRHQF